MPSQTILAATDLSARSDWAVDRAFLLGKEPGLNVAVIHVADPVSSAARDPVRLQDAIRAVLPDRAPNAWSWG